MEIVHIRTNGNDLTDKFVSDHHRHRDRLLGPFVPLIDVKIRPTNAGMSHPNQDVIDPVGWLRDIEQFETRCISRFNQGFQD